MTATALPRDRTSGLERLASLDSSFAEGLLARFSRYFGRLGTPDLDVTVFCKDCKPCTVRGQLEECATARFAEEMYQ
jgi:hypothetical protein